MNAGASAIQGKKFSGEWIANLRKMSKREGGKGIPEGRGELGASVRGESCVKHLNGKSRRK
jgi:hypothetical protein